MIGQGFRGSVGWVVVCCSTLLVIGSRAGAQSGSQGVVVGIVTDAETGKGISGAGIEETSTSLRVGTQADGRYRLELDPGTYELRVVAPFYRARQVPNVVVTTGAETSIDVQLQPSAAGEIELLEVVADAYGGSEASQLLDRKMAPTLSDNISAQMIKLSPDSDAAEIVQRVPAVTIQDDKYLNVRGLNERYTSALLNNNRLPSTDPNRRSVPLDLFPAGFIESISIIKTYTPDLPGDFSGGLASIKLKQFPDELAIDLGVSTIANTQATFQDFETYDGAGFEDFFGYGESFRGLPGIIPEDNVQRPSSSRQREFTAAFRDIWDVETTTAAPGYRANFSVGGPILESFGAALGLTYGTEWKHRDGELAREFRGGQGGAIEIQDDFEYERSNFETTFGVVVTSSYEIAENHQINFRSIYNRESDDQVLSGEGSIWNQAEPLSTRYLQYTVDELAWGQLSGEHTFDWIKADWRTVLSRSFEDQPDGRFDTRSDPDATNVWSVVRFGGRRVFGDLREVLTDSAVDFTIPFRTRLPFTDVWSGLDGYFKLGPAYMLRQREHGIRQFAWSQGPFVDQTLPTEEILVPENIFPGGFRFEEVTQPRDSFEASQEVAAFYGMLELPILGGWADDQGMLWHQLRVIGGARAEYSYIVTETVDNSGLPKQPILNDFDVLPGVNLVYSPIEDVNLRFAWSQAVSRPELRELSPVQFPAPGGLRALAGNEDLISASIESYDVRLEWFPGANDVLSFGVFYKDLKDPIETVLIAQGDNNVDSFANAETAEVIGFEFEARTSLSHLSHYLEGFNFVTNVTYADSEADLGSAAGEGTASTTSQRQLQGQAPFIVNAALDYTHDDWGTVRLLYNTIGERLASVGRQPLPDIFEERRDQLDLVYLTEINPFGTPLNAKLAVENILNDEFSFEQGGQTQREWTTGVKFSFGLSYSY